MKTVAFIPFWLGYQGRDKMKKLAGRYLINYTLEQLQKCEVIDENIIFASNNKIMDYVDEPENVIYMKRSVSLDDKSVYIEQVIEEFIKNTDADIIVLIHPNSPFLSSDTISKCIGAVKSGFDSSFIASKFQKLAWYNNRPLNYSLEKVTPHLNEIEPVVLELSSLYIFKKDTFNQYHRRIGKNPYIHYIDHYEGHDIKSEEDFEMAELIVNSGMYPKVR